MADQTPDPVAAGLEAVKERAEALCASHADEDCEGTSEPCTGHDALRLVAAVEAVLALAGDWSAKAQEIADKITLDANDAGIAMRLLVHSDHQKHAKALREAISAALLGEVPTDG